MDSKRIIEHIVNWLKDYSSHSKTNGFVIGISGGIDSALTSTLCALTSKKVIVLNLPIKQNKTEFERSREHINWLMSSFNNVETYTVDLTNTLESIEKSLPINVQDQLTMANTRSRLRMSTLYAFAGHNKLLVAGTGNKVEDFGIGFFTKYGDGGVDLSPIADLYKTEVYQLASSLGVVNSILSAKPTDGLFEDGRSDEDQIGASYPELEWAMQYNSKNDTSDLTERQKDVLKIYSTWHHKNKHKVEPIPVCLIPIKLKK